MNRGALNRPGSALILLLLALCAAAGYGFEGPERFAVGAEVGFADIIPESVGSWQRLEMRDPKDVPEALQVNEFFQALYGHPEFGRYSVTLEFTSDSRRRFELHYPDVCHQVRGDRVILHPVRAIDAGGRAPIPAAMMEWQHVNGRYQALAVYWYVTAEGVTADSARLKWDQALAGLLRSPQAALLLRVDAFHDDNLTPASRARLLDGVDDLLRSLYLALDEKPRALLFNKLAQGTST